MGKRGKLYSPEFKEEAIRLVHSCEEKYPVAKIARDLDVSAETLRKWVNQAEIVARTNLLMKLLRYPLSGSTIAALSSGVNSVFSGLNSPLLDPWGISIEGRR